MSAPIEHETLWSAVGSVMKGGASYLAEILGRIFCGIRTMAPVAIALGCQAAYEDRGAAPAAEVAAVTPAEQEPVVVPDAGPRKVGTFNITFYYVVGEEEVVARRPRAKAPQNENRVAQGAAGTGEAAEAAAGEAAAAAGEAAAGEAAGSRELAAVVPLVTLYAPGKQCEPIAETTREFAVELAMQGTGKLRDGRVVNIWGPCNCPSSPCWKVTTQQWGTAGTGRPLQPFRTVAVDPKVVKLGSLLHIPLLEGRTMPGRPPWGGFVHDGCVVADDTGGAIRNYHIDLFVGRKAWFLGMSGSPGRHSWARQVPVFDGSKICERKGRHVARRAGSS